VSSCLYGHLGIATLHRSAVLLATVGIAVVTESLRGLPVETLLRMPPIWRLLAVRSNRGSCFAAHSPMDWVSTMYLVSHPGAVSSQPTSLFSLILAACLLHLRLGVLCPPAG